MTKPVMQEREPVKTLACGCTIGWYSRPLTYCNTHYEKILQDRFAPDSQTGPQTKAEWLQKHREDRLKDERANAA